MTGRIAPVTLALASTLLLSACLGTMNSAFKVHGVAPQSGCVLTAFSTETNRKEEWHVAGDFTETIIAGSWSPAPYDVSLTCGGVVKKTLNGVRPSYDKWLHPVELGTVEP